MEAGLPQLNPEWFSSQLFWFFACFVLLYVVMARAIVPRIHEVLETRQDRINHDLDWANSLKAEAEQARANYESALAEARKKAQNMLAETAQSIKQVVEQKTTELDGVLARKIADSETEIEQAMQQASANLGPIAQEATAMIVEKLIAEKPDMDKIGKIISKIEKEASA